MNLTLKAAWAGNYTNHLVYRLKLLATRIDDKNRWNQAEGRLLVRAESTVHLREDGNHSELEHWSCLAHILGSVPFRVHIIFAHHGMCPHFFSGLEKLL